MRFAKKIAGLGVLACALLLSGCMKSVFDAHDARCPFVEKGGCQSMEMVEKMVRERKFTQGRDFVLDSRNINPNPFYRCKGGKSCWKK